MTRWRGWLARLCALALVLLGGTALARDHVVATAWLEDPTGAMSWEQVRAGTFKPYQGVLNRGYTASAHWIRVSLAPVAEAGAGVRSRVDDSLVLRMRLGYHDEIQLFDPLDPPGTRRVTGDTHPRSGDEYKSINLNFRLQGSREPRDVYLRLTGTSAHQIHVAAFSLDDVTDLDRRQEFALGAYFALIGLVLAWALFSWILTRETVIGVFVLRQFMTLMHALAVTGYLRFALGDSVAPWWVNVGSIVCFIGYPAVAVQFDRMFLAEFKPARWGLRALWAVGWLYPMLFVLVAVGQHRAALAASMTLVMLVGVLLLVVAMTAQGWKQPSAAGEPVIPRAALLTLYFAITVSALSTALPTLGLVKSVELTLYSSLLYGLFSSIAMVAVLQMRAVRQARRQAEVDRQLELAQQQTEQERRHRMEQSRFVDMLVHELRTPLSVIRMSADSPEGGAGRGAPIERAVRDMNDIIERCAQASRLSDDSLLVKAVDCTLQDALDHALGRMDDSARLQVAFERDLPLHSDPQILGVIVSNLVDNALKYGPPGEPVQLRVAEQARDGRPGVALSVSNPPGVAGWPDAARVFEKYYRAKDAHRRSGSGLGLYLVRGLAQMLGGEVRYAPTDSHVRFECWVPLQGPHGGPPPHAPAM